MALPAIAGALGGVFLSLVAGFVGRVLASLGVSLVSFYGITRALDFLKELIDSSLSGLPAEMLAVMSMLKIGLVLSMLFSAFTGSMLLNGLKSDTFKKMVLG